MDHDKLKKAYRDQKKNQRKNANKTVIYDQVTALDNVKKPIRKKPDVQSSI